MFLKVINSGKLSSCRESTDARQRFSVLHVPHAGASGPISRNCFINTQPHPLCFIETFVLEALEMGEGEVGACCPGTVWSGCAKLSLNLEPKSYLFTHPHVHPPSARAVAPAMPRMHRPLGVPSCFSCLEFLPASPAPPPLEMIY